MKVTQNQSFNLKKKDKTKKTKSKTIIKETYIVWIQLF